MTKKIMREPEKIKLFQETSQILDDEDALVILLSYKLSPKRARSLAKRLLTEFGDLTVIFSVQGQFLKKIRDLDDHTIALIRLVGWFCERFRAMSGQPVQSAPDRVGPENLRESAFGESIPGENVPLRTAGRGTGMFAKAVLKEAIELLPKLSETDSIKEIREFFVKNLRYSAEQTRRRYTSYVIRRLFPDGYADRAIRVFAQKYANHQALREVCFYRFCKAEPLMLEVIEELFLPGVGSGRLSRIYLRNYLAQRFPYHSTKECSTAIVDALVAGGIARANRSMVSFACREVLVPSFAFILHSEFSEPGMYDLTRLEENRSIRAMLWRPDQILPALYELRNLGIIAKVSEIDSVRQFTTKWNLDRLVENL